MLKNESVDEDLDDVGLVFDDGVYAEQEVAEPEKGGVSVGADLDHGVFEKLDDVWDEVVRDDVVTAFFDVGDLHDGSGCELSDGLVMVAEAGDELLDHA